VAKLIILSILLVTVLVPAWMSSSSQPRKALRRVQGLVVVLVILWGYMCLHWYPALVELK
jgi:hypothetical protein